MDQISDLFISYLNIHCLKIKFETSLIIWANDQHCSCYKCHYLMINLNKFIIYELMISLYMNLKYPYNLWKPLKYLHFTSYHCTFTPLVKTNYNICKNVVIFQNMFFIENLWRKIHRLLNIQEYSIPDMKSLKFINYSTNMRWGCPCITRIKCI
jgi:hypothetical protein